MEITILEEKGNQLKIKVKNEDYTLGNLIQNELLNDSKIEYAGYDVPHPLIRSMIISVKTVGNKKPRKTLKDSLKRLRKKLDEFQDNFEKAKAEKV